MLPFGNKLLEVERFPAEEAMSWSDGAPHEWEKVREMLEALLDHEIRKIREHEHLSEEDHDHLKQQKAMDLVRFAKKHSAFYRRLYQPFDTSKPFPDIFTDLPVINGEASWTLPMPARFVIGQDGVIRYAEVNPDYTLRPEPSDLLPVLRSRAA